MLLRATKLVSHWRASAIVLLLIIFIIMFLLDCCQTSSSSRPRAAQQASTEHQSIKSGVIQRPATLFVHQSVLNRRTEGFKVNLSFTEGQNPMTYRQFLTSLQDGDSELIDFLTECVSSKYKAVFWECNPITQANLDSTLIQFVIIDAPALVERRCDPEPFLEHFQKWEGGENAVISFDNLGKDAMLVVPCPGTSASNRYPRYMNHLASFHRGASKEHVGQLWRKIGDSMLKRIEAESDPDHKFWLSTSGLGVSWLHVRIDDVPKYYNWREYKDG